MYLYGIEITSIFLAPSIGICSNCTFMELKYLSREHVTVWQVSSNCTFMELKSNESSPRALTLISSNCTFMELKWKRLVTRATFADVLIVPLWNWNTESRMLLGENIGSNCTFMELKSLNFNISQYGVFGSNCTFMELKWLWSQNVI